MVARVLLMIAFILGLCSTAQAGRRVAMVVGNSLYMSVPELANPVNDADAIGSVLRSIGFETEVFHDLTRSDFEAELFDFSDRAEGAEIAILYFAGHGIEVNKQNYLIPVDAKLRSDRRIRFETISLEEVLVALEGVEGIRAVFLDACRNNPFVGSMKKTKSNRSIGRGFAAIEAGSGTLISYSASEGAVASDGNGEHSPYASALLTYLPKPGLEIQFLLRKVGDDVRQRTNNAQVPYISQSLPGDSIFLVPPIEAAAIAVDYAAVQKDFLITAEVGTSGAWNAFLDTHGKYKDNLYVRLALEARTKALNAEQRLQAGNGEVKIATRDAEPDIPATAIPQLDEGRETNDPQPKSTNPTKSSKTNEVLDKKKPKAGESKNIAKAQPPEKSLPKVGVTTKPKAKIKPQTSSKKPPSASGEKPSPGNYSLKYWGVGALRAGQIKSQSTPFGVLVCVLFQGGGRKDGGGGTENSRVCRWD